MVPDIIPGFAPGVVREHDTEGMGTIRVELPGLMEITPYWVMPACWPGAGNIRKGSQYPPPDLGSPVLVIFEYGQWQAATSHAFYLTGYYGLGTDGMAAGPDSIYDATSAALAHQRVCFWETEAFAVYAVDEPTDKRVVVEAKASGSKIELNAADGTSGKSETITLEARTLVTLYSRGIVDIRADGNVQIQGRIVSPMKRGEI